MIVKGLRLWGLLILLLHGLALVLSNTIYSPFVEAYLWSVWPYTQLSSWIGWTLLLLAGLSLIPRINQMIQTIISQIWLAIPGKAYSQVWFFIAALLALPIFWVARLRHLRWGDAAILVDGLSFIEAPVIYNWQAPLTVFLHQRLWALLAQPLWGWSVDQVYALVSVICGGFFIFILLNLVRNIGHDPLERGLITGLVLTSGSIQLFFGYVENYTIISLGLIMFLWAGVRVIKKQWPLWTASLILSLTNAFHPSTLVLWPALLYVGWTMAGTGDSVDGVGGASKRQSILRQSWAIQFRQTIIHLIRPPYFLDLTLPPLITVASVLTLMEFGDHGLAAFLGDDRPGGGDHIWFVPLLKVTTEYQRYTMFSPEHLLDWLNLHLLLSVFGLFILMFLGFWYWGNPQSRFKLPGQGHEKQIVIFLGIASFFYVFLTWIWNADYGIRKDWDLFSLPAFVYSILAALLLSQTLQQTDKRATQGSKEKSALAQTTVFIIVISSLHTGAWIYANMLPLPLIR